MNSNRQLDFTVWLHPTRAYYWRRPVGWRLSHRNGRGFVGLISLARPLNRSPNIQYVTAPLVDRYMRRLVEIDSSVTDKRYPAPNAIAQARAAYERRWRQVGVRYLEGIMGLLQLTFDSTRIDVHVVGRTRPMSRPLLLPSYYTSREFDVAVTHELLHRLLSGNEQHIRPQDTARSVFETEPFPIAIHAIIFATQEGVLAPSVLDASRNTLESPYAEAWRLVRREGANSILARCRGDRGVAIPAA